MGITKRRRALLVAATLIAAPIVSAVPDAARAADTAPLACSFESEITITPPVGTTPVWYDWASAAEPATITCHGWLQGKFIAGSGRFTEAGRGHGTAARGRGAVDFVGWLPAADGSIVDVRGHLWLERIALNGTMSGFVNDAFVVGTYAVEPKDAPADSASAASSTVLVRGATEVGDERLAPPAPLDVRVERDRDGVKLSWRKPSSDGRAAVAGFHVYVDGRWVDDVGADTTEYRFSHESVDDHHYTVTAFSSTGLESSIRAAGVARTFEVRAGSELPTIARDGAPLSAVSLRFLPEEIEVHSGDTLHFRSDVPLASVALLPPSVGGDCETWDQTATWESCAPRRWIEEHAFEVGSPWYPAAADPDDGWAKVNNAAAFPPFPACGNPGLDPSLPQQRACEFPLTPESRRLQGTRWGFAPLDPTGARSDRVDGVLASGLADPAEAEGAPVDWRLDFRVKVVAEPGTTFWVVQLFAKEAHLKVTVVDDEVPVATAEDLERARAAQLEADTETAHDLDSRYASHRDLSIEDGHRVWNAFAGVEEGPVALRQSYPRVLTIQPGDRVRWRTDRVNSLVHTLTFSPHQEDDLKKDFFTQQCDVDGDEPAAGHVEDVPSDLPAPVFCPGGWHQVEFDFSNLVGPGFGDGRYEGRHDAEHSGLRGMAPAVDDPRLTGGPLLPSKPYVLEFVERSGGDGFTFFCALHSSLNRPMFGTVVVR